MATITLDEIRDNKPLALEVAREATQANQMLVNNVKDVLEQAALGQTELHEQALAEIYHPLTVIASKGVKANERALVKLTDELLNRATADTRSNHGKVHNLILELQNHGVPITSDYISRLNMPTARLSEGRTDLQTGAVNAVSATSGTIVNPPSGVLAIGANAAINLTTTVPPASGGSPGQTMPTANGGIASPPDAVITPIIVANQGQVIPSPRGMSLGKQDTNGNPLGDGYNCNPTFSSNDRINVWRGTDNTVSNGQLFCRCISTAFGDPGGVWELIATVDTKAECDAISLRTCGTYPTGAMICKQDNPPGPLPAPLPFPLPKPQPQPLPLPIPFPGPQPTPQPPSDDCGLADKECPKLPKCLAINVGCSFDQLPDDMRKSLKDCGFKIAETEDTSDVGTTTDGASEWDMLWARIAIMIGLGTIG